MIIIASLLQIMDYVGSLDSSRDLQPNHAKSFVNRLYLVLQISKISFHFNAFTFFYVYGVGTNRPSDDRRWEWAKQGFDQHGSGGNGAPYMPLHSSALRQAQGDDMTAGGANLSEKKRFWLPLYAASTGHTPALFRFTPHNSVRPEGNGEKSWIENDGPLWKQEVHLPVPITKKVGLWIVASY